MPQSRSKKSKRTEYKATFSLDKTTAGAVRFSEDEEDRDKAMVRTQYIRKGLWEEFEQPEAIEVVIRPVSK